MPKTTDGRYHAIDGMKRCKVCDQVQSVDRFYRRNSTDGYRNDCKDCISVRSKEQYDQGREEIKARSRAWHAANRERVQVRRASWYERSGRERQRARRTAMTAEERRNEYQAARARKMEDPERFRQYEMARRLRRLGISLEYYEQLMAAQEGKCAICLGAPNGNRNVLHIDHDHVDGQVRGLLCHSCNTSLGHFRDNPEVLRRAVSYLLNPPAREMPAARSVIPTDPPSLPLPPSGALA